MNPSNSSNCSRYSNFSNISISSNFKIFRGDQIVGGGGMVKCLLFYSPDVHLSKRPPSTYDSYLLTIEQ